MLIRDNYQNFKSYHIPKAQLIIADIPYNIGKNAYGSNPSWYIDGDNKNGESDKAGKGFFDTDEHEFRDLYQRVKDVIFSTILRGISESEFEKNLINF